MTKTAGRVCICDAVASLSFSKARSPGKGERFWDVLGYSVLFPSPESADCGEVPGLANPLEIDIDISQPEGVYPGLFLGQSFNVHLRHFPQPVPSKVIWWNSCAPFLTRVLTSLPTLPSSSILQYFILETESRFKQTGRLGTLQRSPGARFAHEPGSLVSSCSEQRPRRAHDERPRPRQ